MAWSAAKEEKLRQLEQTAAWRWIGYAVFGFGVILLVWGSFYWLGRLDFGAAPDWRIMFGVPLAVIAVGIAVAVPGENAVKRARVLRAEKAEPTQAPASLE